jgi:hypothetical protein
VYTNTNLDEESQEQPGYWATRSLMFCIDIGIFITSVIVWPLVAAACISLNIFPDDSA